MCLGVRSLRVCFVILRTACVASCVLAAAITSIVGQVAVKRVYIAPDDHTDYFWTADEATYRQAFLDTLDYYLNQADSTASDPPQYQGRWNCDGSFWLWTYEQNKPAADFERLMRRIRDGHISVPLNALAVSLGGAPAEAVLRGMYYPGQIERRYGLRFYLAYTMENQTQPLGLASLWAGSGARYSWKGICGCDSSILTAWDREHDIYRYRGHDGGQILMKWNSMLTINENMGGYAEARFPDSVVDFVTTNADSNGFASRFPYGVIGCFGQGQDDLQTQNDAIIRTAMTKTDASRSVIVSNEEDFFRDFEATYPTGSLPAVSVSFGNEWDLYCAALAEPSARIKRAVEKLRATEALATLVSVQDPCFLSGRETVRNLAWMNFGLYWEHNFGMVGRSGSIVDQRIAWQRRLADEIDAYVNSLHEDARNALGGMISKTGTNLRFYAFNPLGWKRSDMAEIPYADINPVKVMDLLLRTEVPSQIVTINGERRLRILAKDVPPVGYKVFEVQPGLGASFSSAATVSGNVIENSFYRITLDGRGAITSLVDKTHGGDELVRASGGLAINDLGSGSGTVQAGDIGPVTVTLVATAAGPVAHTTRLTLIRDSDRIEIGNHITQSFSATYTWGFGFNVGDASVHHEEVGAVLRAALTTDGGDYSPRNARYDWLTANHFVDIGGSGLGATLSNADAYFFRLGNSTESSLDTSTPLISMLAGGRVANGSNGLPNQGGDASFVQRFALRSRVGWDAVSAMKFALEHQNPLVTGIVSGAGGFRSMQYSLLSVSNPNVLLWSVKPAEEGINRGIATRLWNLSEATASVTVSFTPGSVTGPSEVTHIETPTGPAKLDGTAISAIVPGLGMKTLMARLARQAPFVSPTITVDRSGADVVVRWQSTGQACYRTVRSSTPQLSAAEEVAEGSSTLAVDAGAAGTAGPPLVCYSVD